MRHEQSLLNPKQIQELLNIVQASPKKQWGQSFLVNPVVIGKILDALDLESHNQVLEIGGGLGAITIPIAAQGLPIHVVEIDMKLVHLLELRLQQLDLGQTVTIINQDFLMLKTLPFANSTHLKIFSSLPYSQTSPILHKLIIEFGYDWEVGVFLMQKEVAGKIIQAPPRASYWYHFINAYYNVQVMIKSIKPSSFWPSPKVESSLVRFVRKQHCCSSSPAEWSKFLHCVFKYPRKQIGKAIDHDLLAHANIDPILRPGEVSADQLQRLIDEKKSRERVN